MSLSDRIRARMRGLEEHGLLRALRPPSGVDLSSNDYLGLAADPRIKDAMTAAIGREGVGSTGSRLLRGERDGFAALEARFARFKGTERALYFSSGYLANLAVMTTFAEGDDVIVSDERNHASLIDGIRLSPARREIVAHNDVATVRRLLRAGRAAEAGHSFVVVESLFSMDGDEAPLVQYAAACAATGAHLIVDEAHAVGIYGERGTGLAEERGVADRVFLSINTAGKALGAAGAFVAGPAWAIDYLVQRARPFVFSTAPPPSLAAALDASLDIVEGEPQRRARLRATVERLRARLATAGVPAGAGSSHIIPIFIGDNAAAIAVAEALQADGFDVRAIRPPSVPPGTARLRISVNVNLTDDLIDRFVPALASALAREAGVGAGL
ncbi:MAG TPA: 8-amino-7-oxononanoate synthase [Vicinamibacterales bacterium]|nr:8-amino-7-oxononanoate synthase [Vicinamibacterales bacterium]